MLNIIKYIKKKFWKKRSSRNKTKKYIFWPKKIKSFEKNQKNSFFLDTKKNKFKIRKKQLNINVDFFKKNKLFKIKKVIFYITILLILIISILFIIFWPYFKIKNINILKNDNLTNINISYKAIDNIRWKLIFIIKKKEIFEKLKEYQHNIKDIDLNIEIPNSLKITIKSYKWIFNTSINKKQYIITKNWVLVPSKLDKELKNLIIINNISNNINKFLDYRKVFNEKYINNISTIINKLQKNILNIKIQELTYYTVERELHIRTKNNLLIFSLDEDTNKQIEKIVIFHKQYNSIENYWIYYIDLRIQNKIFYCPIEEKNICTKNIKRIYGT